MSKMTSDIFTFICFLSCHPSKLGPVGIFSICMSWIKYLASVSLKRIKRLKKISFVSTIEKQEERIKYCPIKRNKWFDLDCKNQIKMNDYLFFFICLFQTLQELRKIYTKTTNKDIITLYLRLFGIFIRYYIFAVETNNKIWIAKIWL